MRVLHFLPYYVVGLYVQEEQLNAIRYPRTVGILGILLTFAVCLNVDPSLLGHVYSVPSWEVVPHLVFFLQYMLCGIEAISVILLFRSFRHPLFPYGHTDSTLAIYEWHWPVIGMITWGHIPFTSSPFPHFSDPSLLVLMAQKWHPLTSFFAAHALSYLICVVLGSKMFWSWVRPISDPDCASLFVRPNGNDAKPKYQKVSGTETGALEKGLCFDLEKGVLSS